MPITQFSEETKKALGNYVYCLCYVIDGKRKVFYVGEGINDRVFDHEKKKYSDFTDKGCEISKVLSEGKVIEKFILDCQMTTSSKISGQSIAFHAENALINLAKLSNLGICNSQVGRGFPKRPMTVDEINAFFTKEAITFDIFAPEDKVMIYRYGYHNQSVFNSINVDETIRSRLTSCDIKTKENRELPLHIAVVYRSILQKIYKVTTELIVVLPKNERGRTQYKLKITSIENTQKFNNCIGKSFGKLAPPYGACNPIFTYDKKEPC